jgi:hypothetical protein
MEAGVSIIVVIILKNQLSIIVLRSKQVGTHFLDGMWSQLILVDRYIFIGFFMIVLSKYKKRCKS